VIVEDVKAPADGGRRHSERASFQSKARELDGSDVTEGAVGRGVVVFVAPVLDHDPGLRTFFRAFSFSSSFSRLA
jgi:hypothetical protein